jgi:predicted transcriptional regulator
MTKLLDDALECVRRLPPEQQDHIAHAMMNLALDDMPEAIPPEHLAAVLEGLEQANRREFATQAEIEAVFRRFE